VIDCHYRRLAADGEFLVFESTDGTRSNWDPEIQHGSPPLALMTKLIEERAGLIEERAGLIEERAGLIEERAGDSGLRIARLTLDILGAIPVTRLRLRSWVERPGARISLMAAEMLAPRPDGGERAVARVTAWLLATSDTADAVTDRHPPLVEGDSVAMPHSWEGAKGYLETVSWRRQHGADGDTSVVWLSPLVPLVDSEPTTKLQRLAMVVDSANGAGAALESGEVRLHEHRHRYALAPATRRQ
jgi:Thioesterase-like superfamily